MHWFVLLPLFGAMQLAASASRKRLIPYKWTVLMANRARRSRVHHGGQTLQSTYVNPHANLICVGHPSHQSFGLPSRLEARGLFEHALVDRQISARARYGDIARSGRSSRKVSQSATASGLD